MFNFSDTDFTRLLFVTNVLSNVKINDILVPGLVEIGRASNVTLDCIYSVTNGSDLLLQWYFKDNIEPVYEWRPYKEPIVKGVLEGHLDKLYRVSENPLEARRALRIHNLVPELSGEYTCQVQSGGSRASASKSMIVYKPQEDLSIDWKVNNAEVEVRCTTHGVYPKPDLVLERNRITLDNQHSRSWQNGRGILYDAETVASFRPQELRDSEQFRCRLHLPETQHFDVKETNIIFRNSTYNSLEHHSHKSSINSAIVLTSNFGFNVFMYIIGTVTVIKKCV